MSSTKNIWFRGGGVKVYLKCDKGWTGRGRPEKWSRVWGLKTDLLKNKSHTMNRISCLNTDFKCHVFK